MLTSSCGTFRTPCVLFFFFSSPLRDQPRVSEGGCGLLALEQLVGEELSKPRVFRLNVGCLTQPPLGWFEDRSP